MVDPPALIFSLLAASTCAAAFYLWQGRSLRELPIFWIAAVLGFGAGQWIGQSVGLVPWTIGQVHITEAMMGAFLFLAVTRWLRQEKREK